MKFTDAIEASAEYFPLDWIPPHVRCELYVVACLYDHSPVRLYAPIREPAPEWRIPFRLVKHARRLELYALESRMIGAVHIIGSSVTAPPPDVRRIIALEAEFPDPPEAQTVLPLTSPRSSSAGPEESPQAPDLMAQIPRC